MATTPSDRNSHTIFISAAEQSADMHAARLIRAVRAALPGVHFIGVGGPQMVAAGCESIFDMTQHSAMLLAVLGNVRQGIQMLRTSDHCLRQRHFDAAIVVDSPTLHLPLAGKAHALGIPVLYYIAPQMWAWGGYRIHKLRNRTDRVAVILPFEQEYFRCRGVDATFVGHPLIERMHDDVPDIHQVKKIRAAGNPVIALLPGSRRHVVREVLPGQLCVARRIAQAFPKAFFPVSVANHGVSSVVDELIGDGPTLCVAHSCRLAELIEAADLVLVASGTTALEVAVRRRPMIVMYNGSKLFYHLVARWLIQTPHLSLPNILAGSRIVPEFMPYYTSTEPIAEQAIELLKSKPKRERMIDDLERAVAPIRQGHASERTAAIVSEMIASSKH